MPIPDTTIRYDRERPTPRARPVRPTSARPRPAPAPVLRPRPVPLPRPSFGVCGPRPPIEEDGEPRIPRPLRRVPASSRIRFVQAPRRPREREIGVSGLLMLIAGRQGLPAPPGSWCYCAVDRLAWRMLHTTVGLLRYGRRVSCRWNSMPLRSWKAAGRHVRENRTQVTSAPSASQSARAGPGGAL